MRTALIAVAMLLALSCSCPKPTPVVAPRLPDGPAHTAQRAEPRTPRVSEDHDDYDRVEGQAYDNRCSRDEQCFLGGCNSEICSADPAVASTCEASRTWPSTGALCGCVQATCRWY